MSDITTTWKRVMPSSLRMDLGGVITTIKNNIFIKKQDEGNKGALGKV